MKNTDASFNNSLFSVTATTIAGVLLVFELLAFFSIAFYLMIPVARRSADDLAAYMVVSAHTWTTISPNQRVHFEYNLQHYAGLRIERPIQYLPPATILFPYITLLKKSLADQVASNVETSVSKIGSELWYWLDTTMYGQKIRFGVPRHRLGINPPTTLILIAIFVIVATLFATLVLVRRVTIPLSKLARATAQLASGNTPTPLPEVGVKELATLARSFNIMVREVTSLLSNRTTVLTGIAHDLRTPLSRIRLALALFPKDTDPQLIQEIELDIEDMSRLIEDSLAFAAGVGTNEKKTVDICVVIRSLMLDNPHQHQEIALDLPSTLSVYVNSLALRRILLNLLSNALRYGDKQPISVTCIVMNNIIRIRICDHGIGIPHDELEHVFEPFYRIDRSRNLATGSNGLGLSIAKQLADANNWKISLGPTPGGGVTAVLEIPRYALDRASPCNAE